ncbi:MAG: hypothetical protein ACOZNI_16300 [Myxococcota bacterium]
MLIKVTRIFALFALLLGVMFAFAPDADSATPRRPPGAYYFGPEVVYSNGTQVDFFNPMSDPMPSRQLMAGRVTLEVTEVTSSNIKMHAALRWSADGITWDTPQVIYAGYVTGNGNQTAGTFTDFSGMGTPKPFVQFGVLTQTVSGATFEIARATLIVEPKAASQ